LTSGQSPQQQPQAFPASRLYSIALVVARLIFGTFWLANGVLWVSTASSSSAYFYPVAALELGLGICIILGLARKIAYTASFFYSLVVWAIPASPYGPISTSIGTGITLALLSLLFLLIIGIFGPAPSSIDYQIERNLPLWKSVAEMKKVVVLEDGRVSFASYGEQIFVASMMVIMFIVFLLAYLFVSGLAAGAS
jgi:uncharacterized membrane protein YphA (DoxX/SURF4 family)